MPRDRRRSPRQVVEEEVIIPPPRSRSISKGPCRTTRWQVRPIFSLLTHSLLPLPVPVSQEEGRGATSKDLHSQDSSALSQPLLLLLLLLLCLPSLLRLLPPHISQQALNSTSSPPLQVYLHLYHNINLVLLLLLLFPRLQPLLPPLHLTPTPILFLAQ